MRGGGGESMLGIPLPPPKVEHLSQTCSEIKVLPVGFCGQNLPTQFVVALFEGKSTVQFFKYVNDFFSAHSFDAKDWKDDFRETWWMVGILFISPPELLSNSFCCLLGKNSDSQDFFPFGSHTHHSQRSELQNPNFAHFEMFWNLLDHGVVDFVLLHIKNCAESWTLWSLRTWNLSQIDCKILLRLEFCWDSGFVEARDWFHYRGEGRQWKSKCWASSYN